MNELGIVYNGRHNTIDRLLLADLPDTGRGAIDADQFVRFLLVLGETLLDSNQLGLGEGQPFDSSQSVTWNGHAVKMLRLRLGFLGLAPGSYRARLIVFDSANPNGLVWENALPIKVVE